MCKTNFFYYEDTCGFIRKCIACDMEFSTNGKLVALLSDDTDSIVEFLNKNMPEVKIQLDDKDIFVKY